MFRSRQTLKILLATALSVGLFGITVVSAFALSAHPTLPASAKVIRSDPAIGSTISQAPTKVTVTSAEDINPDPKLSNLVVYGPSNEATSIVISQGDAKVSLNKPTEMSVNITPNTGHLDGVYMVVWKTVSAADGDAASGAFSFTVKTGA